MSQSFNSLTGRWQGKFSYSSWTTFPPCAFNVTLQDEAGALTGEIIEPNSFATDAGDTLLASLSGQRDELSVQFTKSYSDTQSQQVDYSGEANASMTRISGSWQILEPGKLPFMGRFMMARIIAPGATGAVEKELETET